MPITQQPTLNTIEPDKGQFEIVFGVQMQTPENRQGVTIPNMGSNLADVYTVDLSTVVSPARGNVPSIRCLSFTLRAWMAQTAGVPPQASNLYIVNPQTNQVLGLTEPTPGPGFDGVIAGCVPFFMKSNQSFTIYRPIGVTQNCITFLSVSLFTFDLSSYLTPMTPAPSLFSNATPFVLPVRLE